MLQESQHMIGNIMLEFYRIIFIILYLLCSPELSAAKTRSVGTKVRKIQKKFNAQYNIDQHF